MTKVLVLSGGDSDERAVSLLSGAVVTDALQAAGYSVSNADPADGLTDTVLRHVEVVFPVLHGAGGEDGILQARLERMNIPFVGSGSTASALCFNKAKYKELLREKGIPTPVGSVVDRLGFNASPISQRPYVLKPFKGGSSIDTIIARSPDTVQSQTIDGVFTRHVKLLLESLVVGTEITIGVLNEDPLPVIEIIPPANGEFDYENKYNGSSLELCPPRSIDTDTQRQAQELAVRIHKLTGCRGLSRTDIIIGNDGTLWVLETNTLPGMTKQSLYPKAAAVASIPMPELVDRLVRLAA